MNTMHGLCVQQYFYLSYYFPMYNYNIQIDVIHSKAEYT